MVFVYVAGNLIKYHIIPWCVLCFGTTVIEI